MSTYPIKAYVAFIKQLERELRGFTNAKRTAIHSHWETINGRLGEKHGIEPEVLTHGSWDCEGSETGKCYFNDAEDPCNDICLVCGSPEERK